MEDVQWEVAHRELNVPPRGPPLGCWRTLEGDVDDKEVTFLGGRGWEPRGQPPQPAGPPQPEEDVRHLVSTLAARLQLDTPRINTFSSNGMLGKTEVSFKQWYHEVQCVKDHYPELVVWESIVRCVPGLSTILIQELLM